MVDQMHLSESYFSCASTFEKNERMSLESPFSFQLILQIIQEGSKKVYIEILYEKHSTHAGRLSKVLSDPDQSGRGDFWPLYMWALTYKVYLYSSISHFV